MYVIIVSKPSFKMEMPRLFLGVTNLNLACASQHPGNSEAAYESSRIWGQIFFSLKFNCFDLSQYLTLHQMMHIFLMLHFS